jgi:virginiamycin B lyase
VNAQRFTVAALATLALAAGLPLAAGGQQGGREVREYPVPAGSRPHDVAPARDGGVWYTAQGRASWVGSTRRPAAYDTYGSEWAPRRTA